MAIKIKVGDVNITLSKEQLAQIDEQRNKKLTIEDVDGYDAACEILGQIPSNVVSPVEMLETIIKAVNFIDNGGKIWKADFTKSSDYKYLPYFEKSSGGWLVAYVYYYSTYSLCSVGLYYKSENTAKFIAKKFIGLYNQYLG